MSSIQGWFQRPCLDSKCSILSSERGSTAFHTSHRSTSSLDISLKYLTFPILWHLKDSLLHSGNTDRSWILNPKGSCKQWYGVSHIEKTYFFLSLFQVKYSKTTWATGKILTSEGESPNSVSYLLLMKSYNSLNKFFDVGLIFLMLHWDHVGTWWSISH